MIMNKWILHIWMLLAVWLSLPGCSVLSDEDPSECPGPVVQFSLGVSTRAIEGTEADTDVPEDLKVWIYGTKDGSSYTPLDYFHKTKDLFSQTFLGNRIERIVLEIANGKQYTRMKVCVVLNSGNVTWPEDFSLDKETSLETLQGAVFQSIKQDKGDNAMLMYGTGEIEINTGKTNYELMIEVKRAVAKTELFFSKNNAEKELVITGVAISSNVQQGYLVSLGNDIYAADAETMELFENDANDSGRIDCSSTEEYGNFSKDESNFEKLVSAFLMENPSGLDWNVETGTYPDGQADNAYIVHIDYVYDNVEKDKSFYLPKIDRNHLYKIYIRIGDLDWEVDVYPYTGVVLEPEFGL